MAPFPRRRPTPDLPHLYCLPPRARGRGHKTSTPKLTHECELRCRLVSRTRRQPPSPAVSLTIIRASRTSFAISGWGEGKGSGGGGQRTRCRDGDRGKLDSGSDGGNRKAEVWWQRTRGEGRGALAQANAIPRVRPSGPGRPGWFSDTNYPRECPHARAGEAGEGRHIFFSSKNGTNHLLCLKGKEAAPFGIGCRFRSPEVSSHIPKSHVGK